MAVNSLYHHEPPAIKEELQGVTTLWSYPTQAIRTELLPQSYHLVRGPSEGTFALVGGLQYATGFQSTTETTTVDPRGTLTYATGYIQQQQAQGATSQQPAPQQAPLCFTTMPKSEPGEQAQEEKPNIQQLESHSQANNAQNNLGGDEKRFQCDTCNKAFSQSKYLIKHAKTHVGRKFPCSLCNKLLSSSDALRTHSQVHTGLKPYPCSMCGKSYGRKEHLRRHTLIHTKGERVKCEVCHKNFYDATTLQEHSWRHTGYRPYNCAVCNRSFSTEANLQAHIVSLKHKNMAERKNKMGGGGLPQAV